MMCWLLWGFFLVLGSVRCERKNLVDTCMASDNHKPAPAPEPELHGQCKLWSEKACCTEETTRLIHSDPELMVYGFNFSHCKPLSPQCIRHFRQEFCFFACSPNVGPWIDYASYPLGRHRFHGVPLCAGDCKAWFHACGEDLTCAKDWFKDFDWDSGKNVCPANSDCITFKEMFGNAKTFCESVWSGEWVYEEDSSKCLKLWFDAGDNPNAKVASYFAQKAAGTKSGDQSTHHTLDNSSTFSAPPSNSAKFIPLLPYCGWTLAGMFVLHSMQRNIPLY